MLSFTWVLLFVNAGLRGYRLAWLRISVRGHVLTDVGFAVWAAIGSIVAGIISSSLRADWSQMAYTIACLIGAIALVIIVRRVGRRVLFAPTVHRMTATVNELTGVIVTTRYRFGEQPGRRRWYAPWSRYN